MAWGGFPEQIVKPLGETHWALPFISQELCTAGINEQLCCLWCLDSCDSLDVLLLSLLQKCPSESQCSPNWSPLLLTLATVALWGEPAGQVQDLWVAQVQDWDRSDGWTRLPQRSRQGFLKPFNDLQHYRVVPFIENSGGQWYQLRTHLLHSFMKSFTNGFSDPLHFWHLEFGSNQRQRKRSAVAVLWSNTVTLNGATCHICSHVTGSPLAGVVLDSGYMELHSCTFR